LLAFNISKGNLSFIRWNSEPLGLSFPSLYLQSALLTTLKGGFTAIHAAFTFKTSEQNYYFLEEKPGYRPAPYLTSRGMKWIQQYNFESDEDEALEYYLSASYKLVSLELTKKMQKELGLNQPQ